MSLEAQKVQLLTLLVIAATLLAGFALASFVTFAVNDGERWDPLGDYPQQQVLEVSDTAVTVEGTKCNDTQEAVTVIGSVSWQRVWPLGAIIGTGTGTSIRIPGCETFVFVNTFPDTVLAANSDEAQWRIIGVETPIEDSGRGIEGVPRVFETEMFTIPDGP